jgi:hypothetical protein
MPAAASAARRRRPLATLRRCLMGRARHVNRLIAGFGRQGASPLAASPKRCSVRLGRQGPTWLAVGCPWATGRVLADCGPARMRPVPCAAENARRAQPGAGHGRVRSSPIGESRRAWPPAGILSSLSGQPGAADGQRADIRLWPAGAGAADLHRGRAVWPTAAACVLACVAPMAGRPHDGRRHAVPPMRGNYILIRYALRATMVFPAAVRRIAGGGERAGQRWLNRR